MEAIGQLTGGIAHDFNNLLTVIIGMNEILARRVADNPQLAELAQSRSTTRPSAAPQLAQRMLAFARKQPLKPRVLDLNEIVTRHGRHAARRRSASTSRSKSRSARPVAGAGRSARGWRTQSSTSPSMPAMPCRAAAGC